MATSKEIKRFADVNIGDELSPFTIDETQETIDAAVVRLEEDGTTDHPKTYIMILNLQKKVFSLQL